MRSLTALLVLSLRNDMLMTFAPYSTALSIAAVTRHVSTSR
jgi:hypothetical protein